ncbi:histidine kinase [Glycomyces halotolerans]
MDRPLRRARRADLIAAAALFAAGSVLTALGSYERFVVDLPIAVRFVPLALVCFGVAVRRAHPGWCLTAGLAGFGIELGIGISLAAICILTDNLYSFARYGPRRALQIMLPATAACILAYGVWAALGGNSVAAVVSTMAIAAVILVSPPITAIIVRQAHDRAELEAERAEQTARLADARRREAVLRERTLMARELHDTVANYLSAIALQSTGLQAREHLDAATVQRSVAAIRQSSVDGLAELRRIIGLLRGGEADEELAAFRLDQLPELVDRMRRVGLKVELDIEGPPREVPDAVATAAYRVVQESLTNALKYGADAAVAIAYEPERLTVAVDNAIDASAAAVPSGGAGLVGMTERVRLLGGTVRTGPDGERWHVRAEIPTGGAP